MSMSKGTDDAEVQSTEQSCERSTPLRLHDDSATDSGYFGNTAGTDAGMMADSHDTPSEGPELANEASESNVYRDKMTVNEVGLQDLLKNPMFTAMASSTISPDHVGYLNVQLPNEKTAEIIVFKNFEQTENVSGPVIDALKGFVKTKEPGDMGSQWIPMDSEFTMEGSGDGLSGSVPELDKAEVATNILGEGNTPAPFTPVQSKEGVPAENTPLGTGETGNASHGDDVYQEVLAAKRKQSAETEAETKRQRSAQVQKLKEAIAQERRKQAEAKASLELERAKKAEKEAHDKELADLQRQLAVLQNPPKPQVTPITPKPVTPMQPGGTLLEPTPGSLRAVGGPVKPSVPSAYPVLMPGATMPLTQTHGQSGVPVGAYSASTQQGLSMQDRGQHTPVKQGIPVHQMPGAVPYFVHGNSGPFNTPGVSPQKPANSGAFNGGSNRRSPRANVSSIAYDATRKHESPLVMSRPTSTFLPGQASGKPVQGSAFVPLAASSPGQGNVSRSAVMSPKSRKRPPSVTGNVLEQLLEHKRAKKTLGPHQSPRPKSGGNLGSEDMRSQSEMKYKLAKDLDVILQETLKQGNINKIRQRVESAGFQAIPLPEAIPEDLFCYAASLFVADITETDATKRAAIMRKNCLEYVVGQMFQFTKMWMQRYFEEKQSDPYAWISKHQSAETKIDGLFVILMAAYLRKPIQILSHTDTWASDANIAGPITMIFAGDNEFTAAEVADRSYWAHLRHKAGVPGPTLEVLQNLLTLRKEPKNIPSTSTASGDSDASTLHYGLSDADEVNEEKKKKKKKSKLQTL